MIRVMCASILYSSAYRRVPHVFITIVNKCNIGGSPKGVVLLIVIGACANIWEKTEER